MDDRPHKSLQESILTTLVFDAKFGAMIAAQVKAEHFDEGPYREIAERVLEYRRQYSRPPGLAHLDDLFGRAIQEGDRRAPRLRRLLSGMVEQSEGLNAEYVAGRTQDHIRRQQLKQAIYQAGERYQQGGDDVITDVEQILHNALRAPAEGMDAGLFLNDAARGLSFLDRVGNSGIPLGIPEFDHIGACMVPKELLLYIAPKGTGKTWFCIHCGKQALLQRQRVLHVTLEIREEEVAGRYYQSLFGAARRGDRYSVSELEFNDFNKLTGFKTKIGVKPRLDFSSPDTRKVLLKKMKPWGMRLGRIVIKEFPTTSLTISQLVNYLDFLELAHSFVPDILIIDYPDLMDIPTRDYRLGVRRAYEQLRGLGVKRNMAVVAPTQSNRSGLSAKTTTADMVGEDKSKLDTSDTVLLYSQTKAEYRRGLARVQLEYTRTGPRDIQMLITQSYTTGQWLLQSARMQSAYWEKLKQVSGDDGEGEDDS